MTAARLLLAVAGGGRSFPALPAIYPPPGGWVRSGSNPIITPDEDWEETTVGEVSILVEDGTWKMWYSGGWDNPARGYATSTDGISWTRYAGNPVLGQGGSGVSGTAVHASVMKHGSTYYHYYADDTPDGNLRVATSADGLSWSVQAIALAKNVVGWCTGWANTSVWVEGSTWYMLAEGRSGSIWETAALTSTDGLSWTFLNGGNQLTTLQVVAGGMYGGPHVVKIGATYHCWYHASSASGSLPTNIYHATSTDRITWTRTSGAVLTHAASGFEIDQVADPCTVVVDEIAYLFYEGVDNPNETGKIGVATAPAI